MASDKHPFEYQAPTPDHVARIQRVRDAAKTLYDIMIEEVPPSAERTLAMRALEESSMWANKAIVFDGQYYLNIQGVKPEAPKPVTHDG